MNYLTLLASIAVLTSAAPTGEVNILKRDPGTTVLYPDGLPTNEALNTLPTSPYTRVYWWDITALTAGCKSHGASNNCASNDIDIFEVAFQDSPGHTWTLCRCRNNKKVTEDEFIKQIGRIEPGVRQFVRSFMAFDTGSDGAYSINNDVVFKGKVTPSVALHETAHTVDGSNGGYSGKQSWKDAVAKDTCYPDPYARNSPAENWAQIMVLTRYRTAIGPLPTGVNGNTLSEECLWNQIWAQWAQVWPHLRDGFVKSKTHPMDSKVPR